MEVAIRYAHTTDGVNIAFWTFGSGEPMVYMAGAPWCHSEFLQVPECVNCRKVLRPLDGDCCVFCSFADRVCPVKQLAAVEIHSDDKVLSLATG